MRLPEAKRPLPSSMQPPAQALARDDYLAAGTGVGRGMMLLGSFGAGMLGQ